MSGTLPVHGGFSGLTINSNFSVIRNTSVSGIVTTTRLPGHFWSFTVNYPNVSRTEFQNIMGFLNSQEGFDTFTFQPTRYKDADGAATARKSALTGTISTNLNINATKAIGTSSGITFTSAFTLANSYYDPAQHGNFFNKGDFIKFTGHNKVYQITNDVQLASDGSGSIDITPRLQAEITASDDIVYTDVSWTVITTDDIVTGDSGLGDTHSISIELREKP
jgi:hypothetical protein